MPEPSDVAAPEATLDTPVGDQHVDTVPDATPAETFDWTPYADHQVTVKVNGEDQAISLKEALAGYSRQSDYTKKSQDLAKRAQELEFYEALGAALERNPEETINFLQESYGLSAADAAAVADELNPEDERWNRVDQFISQQEQQQTNAQIEAELKRVSDQYQLDPNAILKHAIKMDVPLHVAARDLMFDDVYAEASAVRQARAERETQQKQADEAAREAARAQAGLVAGGHSVSSGAVSPGTSQRMSLKEAFRAAQQQHGF